MTIYSLGVVNKQGRIILSRQFVDITRIRVEGLLTAFPRLLEANHAAASAGNTSAAIATYVDAGNFRYVYQPLEELYLVLITSAKESNIVEDLATLQLMGSLVREQIPEGVTESSLERNTFALFFAFDEVVVEGRRETVTAEQVHVYLEMDSHEERIAMEEKKKLIENAKKITAERARQIRGKQKEMGHNAYGGIGSDSPNYGGFGSGSGGGGGGGGVDAYSGGFSQPAATPYTAAATPSTSSGAGARAGMSLGKARKTDISAKVQREMGGGGGGAGAGVPPAQAVAPAAAESAGAREGLHVSVEEKMTAVLSRDGDVQQVDVKGELTVFVSDPASAHARLQLRPVNPAFTFKAHAKVNKTLFASDHVLAMADDRPLPVQQPVSILRWKLSDATAAPPPPLAVTAWPQGNDSINVEYELASGNVLPSVERAVILIPVHGQPVVSMEPSVGEASLSADKQFVQWLLPTITAGNNSEGFIDIHMAAGAGEGLEEPLFLPAQLTFVSNFCAGLVEVHEAVSTETGMPLTFSSEVVLHGGPCNIV